MFYGDSLSVFFSIKASIFEIRMLLFSVKDMRVSSKSEIIAAIERFIPSKMIKTKYRLSWLDCSIKCLIRKRGRLYFRTRKSTAALTSRAITKGSEHMFKRSLEMHIGYLDLFFLHFRFFSFCMSSIFLANLSSDFRSYPWDRGNRTTSF